MRRLITVLIMLAALLLSGCIDITQHITKDKKGLTCVYIKIGIAKPLLQMAQAADESTDPFEAYSEFNDGKLFKDMPEGAQLSIEKIDNVFEYGVSMTLAFDMQKYISHGMIDPGESNPFLPVDRGTKITIDLPVSDDPTKDNLMAKAMMESFKYRLIIGRSLMPNISRVIVSTPDFDYKPELVSLPDIYIVEMPISYLMSGKDNCQIILEK